jgi:6-phosphogluconolactonase
LTREKKNLVEFSNEIISCVINNYHSSILKKGFYTLVLTGGNTPLSVFDILATEKRIDWKKVYIFWADERCVPQSNSDNNYYNAYQRFIKHHDFGGVFPINTNLSPEQAAKDYENTIQSFFRENKIDNFDTVLLGMGMDGHIASIFDSKKKTNDFIVNTLASNYERVSMTLEFINTTKDKILMLRGKKKIDLFNDKHTDLPKDKIKLDTIIYFDDSIQ